MNTPFRGLPEGGARIVYVRPVAVADLPDELRAQIEGGVEMIYSVHAPDGQRLALVSDRNMAFHLARAHDFAPVSVH
ncbi:DUF1150 domain-containing protein [Rhodobacter sp. Har01]|uniref:DUF1150 family protein n=1 Tax=Rhodobacter sp. Har01 TaxID=2883999 RepID=UPI001D07D0B4|nr:DUF1150 family protein [Rhodobacter sp. Har01]MCB6179214.1 DUF1150 domain-containing protein [Rhodobacter sp. Har01]